MTNNFSAVKTKIQELESVTVGWAERLRNVNAKRRADRSIGILAEYEHELSEAQRLEALG